LGGGVDGTKDGTKEGASDGTKEDTLDGTKEGASDGTKEDTLEGTREGTSDGTKEDTLEGTREGASEGILEWESVRMAEGGREESSDGGTEGAKEGGADARMEGKYDLRGVGAEEGKEEDDDVGVCDALGRLDGFEEGRWDGCMLEGRVLEDGNAVMVGAADPIRARKSSSMMLSPPCFLGEPFALLRRARPPLTTLFLLDTIVFAWAVKASISRISNKGIDSIVCTCLCSCVRTFGCGQCRCGVVMV
jgi:hypothetical protein